MKYKFSFFIQLYLIIVVILNILIEDTKGSYLSWRNKKPDSYKLICYVTNWAQYRPESTKYIPSDIDPYLCTHVIYAFAAINTTTHEIRAYEWNDESKDNKTGRYEELNNLKKKNPLLRTLLAVGGWNMGSKAFSDMAISEENRRTFISSVVKFLRKWKFDGLDIDWEFPAKRDGSRAEDRQSLNYLVEELREAFYYESLASQKEQLLLSIAVSAEKHTILNGYDVKSIEPNLDFLSIMSYDYHGSWDRKLGHNSPLFSRHDESDDDKRLSVDYTVRLFLTLGIPLEKLILGIPFYGRTFTMKNNRSSFLGAESIDSGKPGEFTREAGFLSLGFEICKYIQSGNWTREWSYQHKVPYAHHKNQWVGYDDEESIRLKTDYVVRHCLGGAMIWTLDLDDFRNFCYDTTYPMTRLIASILKRIDRKKCERLDFVKDIDVPNVSYQSMRNKTSQVAQSQLTVEEFLDSLYDELMNITSFNNSSDYNITDIDTLNLNANRMSEEDSINDFLSFNTKITGFNSNNTLNYVNQMILEQMLRLSNRESDFIIRNITRNNNTTTTTKIKSSSIITVTSVTSSLVSFTPVTTVTTQTVKTETTSTKQTETTVKETKRPKETKIYKTDQPCIDQPDGELISDPNDCTSFYTCFMGAIITKRKCSNNLYFDPRIKVCNWPSEVICDLDEK